MELYEAISLIRKKKNIKINEVIGNNMSRSTFNRYVNGITDLYSTHLIEILDSLKISLDELQLIANNYSESNQNILLSNIKEAFEKRDINNLNYLHKIYTEKYKTERNVLYLHGVGLIEILAARLKKETIDLSNNSLYQYLIKTETWTRYELVMFNNSMFFFNVEAVKNILPKAIDRLGYYRNFHHYTDEVHRLLSNTVIYFMQHNDFHTAFNYIQVMEKIELSEEHALERILSKLFEGIKLLLMDSSYAQKQLEQCIQVMDFLELKNLKYMSEQVISELREMKKNIL